jgi:hypothetical protein
MAPSTSNNATGLTALAAAASSSTASGRNMAEDDASLDEMLGIHDHHGAPEVQEVAPNKDPIEDAALDSSVNGGTVVAIHPATEESMSVDEFVVVGGAVDRLSSYEQ